ncbi:alcohol dehydrogenase [Streptomyces viridochromogenes]|uniref:Alcohol dehydrogenase n=1 Tax=Streptomyces viridochromogenes TaxID=1938 RepID=A0A0J7Z9D6_STRVR|nr:phosphonoacetaldehyde reductase [Streptomyces viridochromogenes]KMS72077.1 alcohol dehydrogenase [Streptomyces viridochromogenes]KOG08637.1 alcohol dehydrogenase [Streptomyces viridochromogenes]KOG08684.1 alcohol dehydrogenase [Streptomyces viridochromogenes]
MKLGEPVVRYGRGAVTSVPELVEGMSAGRVLVVHGARSFEASGAARMLSAFGPRTRVRRWHDFSPNPDIRELEPGLALVRDLRPDTVVGVGGGSALDMAKLLCALADVPPGDIEERIRSGAAIDRRRMNLVLVPTTSGSGSEATHFAVVYIGDDKFSVAGAALLPDAAVLDPALSESGSAYQRAASGMDAVAQGIESLWAVHARPESRGLALRGLRLLLSAIVDFVSSPHAGAARSMTVGSHLVGRAINLSRTTGAHALSYGITRRYGVSHGHAVALTLGAFLDAHARAGSSDLQPAVRSSAYRRALDDIAGLLGAPGPAESGRCFVALARRLGLPMSLSEVGVRSPAEVRGLAAAANVQRLGNNPVRFSPNELTELLLRC